MSSFADLTLTFDILIIGLLAVAIAYAIVLNRRLAALRDAKGEIEAAMTEFADVLARAKQGAAGLRQAAELGGNALQAAAAEASRVTDDLAALKDQSDVAAGRLEKMLRKSEGLVTARGGEGPALQTKLSAQSFAAVEMASARVATMPVGTRTESV